MKEFERKNAGELKSLFIIPSDEMQDEEDGYPTTAAEAKKHVEEHETKGGMEVDNEQESE